MAVEEEEYDLSMLTEFVLPAEAVQEVFQGLPLLYNPSSAINGLGNFPHLGVVSSKQLQVAESELEQRNSEDEVLYRPSHSWSPSDDLTFSELLRNILLDLAHHWGVKYWVALLTAVFVLPLGRFPEMLIWFGLGVGGAIMVCQVIWRNDFKDSNPSSYAASEQFTHTNNYRKSADLKSNGILTGKYVKSQGWMLTLPPTESPYPSYNALNFHLRKTIPVFIRVDGPNLLISHPHPKHQIPKRRFWNDPAITSEMVFIRHQHYHLYSAKIEIVPSGLANKRVWDKKYPIAITLTCRDRHVGQLVAGTAKSKSPVSGERKNATDKADQNIKAAPTTANLYKEGNCAGNTIFLFARTDREKDDWFRRLIFASKFHSLHQLTSKGRSRNTPDFSHFVSYMKRACPTLYIPTMIPNQKTTAPRSATPTSINDVFETVLIPNMNPPKHANHHLDFHSNSRKSKSDKDVWPHKESLTPSFLNALLARVFYDFLRSPRWTHEVKQRIDKMISAIKKPKVVESLKVRELDLGDSLPTITNASSPVLDKQGLWVDLDVSFTGNAAVTIEAYVNLFNMGKTSDTKLKLNAKSSRRIPKPEPSRAQAMLDDDEDDSGESSESEDELEFERDAETLKKNINKDHRSVMIRYADAIAKSRVMRNKHVQKVVGNIAATPLLLTVEIKRLEGSIVINIPPVPNDRIWIGFRTNPIIDINATPKVGERVVSLSQVSGWIKKKMLLEFQRVLVCPNMIDFVIPLMEFELPK